MQHFTGTLGNETEDILLPCHHKLRQHERLMLAGKIHQVAQKRGLGMAFGKAEGSLDRAMETIPARQGRMVGNLLHAEVDRAGRFHSLT